ncbi:LysR family transcriptional regulator [Pleionea sp. CnH1-48]|uniref:LysR family transcriptional regulator n=1 Tax=Pleionea sp. CnH1-48 TaxID=2954494 RepID=UPI00209759F6|nr:LysR family transcriptional regulator [Pleionea sp. CnH1-48]MCO7223156.1 LysR family transcriptional regulator [Pleionea sp. CnH1-48]
MQLEDLEVVLKVAKFRSITAAAAHLDMRVATASAALKRVETALGAELFIRTTRHLRLSSVGERYIPQCEQALLMLEQARQNMQDDMDVVEGELRLSLSSDLGRNIAMPWLDEFVEDHPKVSLKLHITDSNIDFFRDSVDIALRYGSPKDSHLYGFKICNVPTLLCATQEYLNEYSIPQHPQDLALHNGLFYQLYDVIHDVWKFSRDEQEFKIKMHGNRASNDGDLVRRWCVAGKGLAIKSSLDMSNDLLSGRVVSVMPDYQPRQTELWLICPSRQLITPAVRLLRDHLRNKSMKILSKLVERKFILKSSLE